MGEEASGMGDKMCLKHLPHILGDATPELPRNAVGRHRLVRVLQQRFGSNYRSLPGIQSLIKEFDTEVENESVINRIAAIKLSDFKRGK